MLIMNLQNLRQWYVINDENKADHGEGNEDGTTIKFETKVIKASLIKIIWTDIFL